MKELHITGDPGQNNAFTEVTVEHGGFNPAAQHITNNYYIGDKELTRRMFDLDKIKQEIHDELKRDIEERVMLGVMMPGAKVASFLAFVCRIFGYHFFFIAC